MNINSQKQKYSSKDPNKKSINVFLESQQSFQQSQGNKKLTMSLLNKYSFQDNDYSRTHPQISNSLIEKQKQLDLFQLCIKQISTIGKQFITFFLRAKYEIQYKPKQNVQQPNFKKSKPNTVENAVKSLKQNRQVRTKLIHGSVLQNQSNNLTLILKGKVLQKQLNKNYKPVLSKIQFSLVRIFQNKKQGRIIAKQTIDYPDTSDQYDIQFQQFQPIPGIKPKPIANMTFFVDQIQQESYEQQQQQQLDSSNIQVTQSKINQTSRIQDNDNSRVTPNQNSRAQQTPNLTSRLQQHESLDQSHIVQNKQEGNNKQKTGVKKAQEQQSQRNQNINLYTLGLKQHLKTKPQQQNKNSKKQTLDTKNKAANQNISKNQQDNKYEYYSQASDLNQSYQNKTVVKKLNELSKIIDVNLSKSKEQDAAFKNYLDQTSEFLQNLNESNQNQKNQMRSKTNLDHNETVTLKSSQSNARNRNLDQSSSNNQQRFNFYTRIQNTKNQPQDSSYLSNEITSNLPKKQNKIVIHSDQNIKQITDHKQQQSQFNSNQQKQVSPKNQTASKKSNQNNPAFSRWLPANINQLDSSNIRYKYQQNDLSNIITNLQDVKQFQGLLNEIQQVQKNWYKNKFTSKKTKSVLSTYNDQKKGLEKQQASKNHSHRDRDPKTIDIELKKFKFKFNQSNFYPKLIQNLKTKHLQNLKTYEKLQNQKGDHPQFHKLQSSIIPKNYIVNLKAVVVSPEQNIPQSESHVQINIPSQQINNLVEVQLLQIEQNVQNTPKHSKKPVINQSQNKQLKKANELEPMSKRLQKHLIKNFERELNSKIIRIQINKQAKVLQNSEIQEDKKGLLNSKPKIIQLTLEQNFNFNPQNKIRDSKSQNNNENKVSLVGIYPLPMFNNQQKELQTSFYSNISLEPLAITMYDIKTGDQKVRLCFQLKKGQQDKQIQTFEPLQDYMTYQQNIKQTDEEDLNLSNTIQNLDNSSIKNYQLQNKKAIQIDGKHNKQTKGGKNNNFIQKSAQTIYSKPNLHISTKNEKIIQKKEHIKIEEQNHVQGSPKENYLQTSIQVQQKGLKNLQSLKPKPQKSSIQSNGSNQQVDLIGRIIKNSLQSPRKRQQKPNDYGKNSSLQSKAKQLPLFQVLRYKKLNNPNNQVNNQMPKTPHSYSSIQPRSPKSNSYFQLKQQLQQTSNLIQNLKNKTQNFILKRQNEKIRSQRIIQDNLKQQLRKQNQKNKEKQKVQQTRQTQLQKYKQLSKANNASQNKTKSKNPSRNQNSKQSIQELKINPSQKKPIHLSVNSSVINETILWKSSIKKPRQEYDLSNKNIDSDESPIQYHNNNSKPKNNLNKNLIKNSIHEPINNTSPIQNIFNKNPERNKKSSKTIEPSNLQKKQQNENKKKKPYFYKQQSDYQFTQQQGHNKQSYNKKPNKSKGRNEVTNQSFSRAYPVTIQSGPQGEEQYQNLLQSDGQQLQIQSNKKRQYHHKNKFMHQENRKIEAYQMQNNKIQPSMSYSPIQHDIIQVCIASMNIKLLAQPLQKILTPKKQLIKQLSSQCFQYFILIYTDFNNKQNNITSSSPIAKKCIKSNQNQEFQLMVEFQQINKLKKSKYKQLSNGKNGYLQLKAFQTNKIIIQLYKTETDPLNNKSNNFGQNQENQIISLITLLPKSQTKKNFLGSISLSFLQLLAQTQNQPNQKQKYNHSSPKQIKIVRYTNFLYNNQKIAAKININYSSSIGNLNSQEKNDLQIRTQKYNSYQSPEIYQFNRNNNRKFKGYTHKYHSSFDERKGSERRQYQNYTPIQSYANFQPGRSNKYSSKPQQNSSYPLRIRSESKMTKKVNKKPKNSYLKNQSRNPFYEQELDKSHTNHTKDHLQILRRKIPKSLIKQDNTEMKRYSQVYGVNVPKPYKTQSKKKYSFASLSQASSAKMNGRSKDNLKNSHVSSSNQFVGANSLIKNPRKVKPFQYQDDCLQSPNKFNSLKNKNLPQLRQRKEQRLMQKLDSFKKNSEIRDQQKIQQTRTRKNRRSSGKNIKFGKSSRFQSQSSDKDLKRKNSKSQIPGPGYYEIKSEFERHAIKQP